MSNSVLSKKVEEAWGGQTGWGGLASSTGGSRLGCGKDEPRAAKIKVDPHNILLCFCDSFIIPHLDTDSQEKENAKPR